MAPQLDVIVKLSDPSLATVPQGEVPVNALLSQLSVLGVHVAS